MTRGDDVDASSRWRHRPLCNRYAAVAFRATATPKGEVERAQQVLLWALGHLPDGESELLGIWTSWGSAATVTRDVLAQLHDRGVESFRVLTGRPAALGAPVLLQNVPGSVDRGGMVIPLQGQALRKSSVATSLRPGTRRAALAADELVAGIDRRLRSALARHGVFHDPADALGFVAEFLMRADRRLNEQPVRQRNAPFSGSARATVAHA